MRTWRGTFEDDCLVEANRLHAGDHWPETNMPATYTAPMTIRKMDHFQAVLHAKKGLLDVRFLNIHMICLQQGSHIGMIYLGNKSRDIFGGVNRKVGSLLSADLVFGAACNACDETTSIEQAAAREAVLILWDCCVTGGDLSFLLLTRLVVAGGLGRLIGFPPVVCILEE